MIVISFILIGSSISIVFIGCHYHFFDKRNIPIGGLTLLTMLKQIVEKIYSTFRKRSVVIRW